MIKQQMQTDQIQAMKSKDSVTLQTLRYILAQFKNQEIEKKEDLTDEEALQTLRKELKKLQDSIESFEKGGRQDLAEEYRVQRDILAKYMPAEMSDEDLKKEINAVIENNKSLAESNPNALIGVCVRELKAKADPTRISKLLREMQ